LRGWPASFPAFPWREIWGSSSWRRITREGVVGPHVQGKGCALPHDLERCSTRKLQRDATFGGNKSFSFYFPVAVILID
jgi:hypothetical protein